MFSASVYTDCLIVATFTALLACAAGASAQSQAPAQSDNGQSVPDAPAPQPQKKPAPKPEPPSDSSDSSSQSAPPADAPASKPPAAKDDNPSRKPFPATLPSPPPVDAGSAKPSAAKDNPFPKQSPGRSQSASQPDNGAKKSGAEDNPFPEAVSRDAAKAAGNDQNPAPKSDLPPGVSSSQSSGSLSDSDNPAGAGPQVNDPVRAKRERTWLVLLKNGDYQGALLRYQDAMAVDPTNVDAISVWPRPSTCSRKMRTRRATTSSISISYPTDPKPNGDEGAQDPSGRKSKANLASQTKVVVPQDLCRFWVFSPNPSVITSANWPSFVKGLPQMHAVLERVSAKSVANCAARTRRRPSYTPNGFTYKWSAQQVVEHLVLGYRLTSSALEHG